MRSSTKEYQCEDSAEHNGESYPEKLLACKVRMPGVCPQSTGDEASLCVCWNPVETSSCPLLLFIVIVCAFEVRMFVRMKSVLLIISCEFNTKDDDTRQRKNDV